MIFRAIIDQWLNELLTICSKAGVPVVYDIDDLVFMPDLVTPKNVDSLRFLSEENKQQYLDSIPLYKEALLASDYCTASTEFLAERCRELGKTTFVLPNGLSKKTIHWSEIALRSRTEIRHDRQVTIGYFSGTKTHQKDFAVVCSALSWVLQEFPSVRLKIVGELDLDEFPILSPFMARIQVSPLVLRSKLPEMIASVDINIAPLEISNPFCESKSELKYFEAAVVKVPTIASTTNTFKRAIEHGRTGMLAQTDEEWYQALKFLITEPSVRRQIGEEAYQDVMQKYHPNVLGAKIAQVYSEIIGSS